MRRSHRFPERRRGRRSCITITQTLLENIIAAYSWRNYEYVTSIHNLHIQLRWFQQSPSYLVVFSSALVRPCARNRTEVLSDRCLHSGPVSVRNISQTAVQPAFSRISSVRRVAPRFMVRAYSCRCGTFNKATRVRFYVCRFYRTDVSKWLTQVLGEGDGCDSGFEANPTNTIDLLKCVGSF